VLHRDLPNGSVETESAADQLASCFLLPRNVFSREFRTRKFTWQRVFELKRRWHVGAGAILRRARDLELLDEMSYRRAFQYMSYKKWRSIGDPFEPAFQEPELFLNAISTLGSEVKKTLLEFCDDLQFSQSVFTKVTGIPVPPVETMQARILPFRER